LTGADSFIGFGTFENLHSKLGDSTEMRYLIPQNSGTSIEFITEYWFSFQWTETWKRNKVSRCLSNVYFKLKAQSPSPPPPPPVQSGVVPYRQHQGSSGGSAMVAQLLSNHQAAEAQRNCSCSSNMAVATKEVADGAQASKPVLHCSCWSLGSGTTCRLAGHGDHMAKRTTKTAVLAFGR
jgi:hypothetical protein